MKIEPSSTLPFKGKITVGDFKNLIKKLDLISILMRLQELSTLMSSQVAVNVNLEFELYTAPRIKHKAGTLTRDFISFCAKQALLYCDSSDRLCNDLDLVNLIYKYGNIETDLNYAQKDPDSKWLWPIRATNQQWFYLRFYSSIIGRYYYLFSKVLKDDESFKNTLNKSLEIDLFDIMKIGACIFANFCPRNDGKLATSFQIRNYTDTEIPQLKSLLTEDNLLKFLNIFSISLKGFKKENKKFKVKNKLLKKYEFNSLKRFPVIRTDSQKEDEKYIIPSLSDFVYGCFEGLYYILLDKLNAKDKDKLFQKFGDIFEKYIGKLTKYYNVDTSSKAKLFSEQLYIFQKNNWKSADWTLVSKDYIFQIECKKRKLDNYSRAGLQSRDNKGIITLFKDVAKELDKLIKKEEHIRDNKIKKINFRNQRIINIIVFLDEMFAVNRFARAKIKNEMKNKSDNFYILGCWEFELLCQHSKNKSLNFYDSLQDLINERINDVYSIDFIDRVFHNFFDSLKSPNKKSQAPSGRI